jgi:hypothetical protein
MSYDIDVLLLTAVAPHGDKYCKQIYHFTDLIPLRDSDGHASLAALNRI